VTSNEIKVLFAGEGGQGVQVIAEILAQAAFLEGKAASYIPNFGVEQRGGASLAFVIVDDKPIVYPKFEKADILVILSNRSRERVNEYADSKTKIIKGPAVEEGIKTKLPPQVWNIVVLGEINRIGKLVKRESLIKAMDERFARQFKRKLELRKLDLSALNNERL